jgi:beta-galactosidase
MRYARFRIKALLQLVVVGALTVLAPFTVSFAEVPPAANTAPRQAMALVDGWRFNQANALTGAEQPEFDDSAWATVSVPHTWNQVGYYLPQVPGRLNTEETVNKTQGIGWYRLTFTPSEDFRGRKAWLQFDAASRTAEVWLNGVRLGAHAGGFSRFRLDATTSLRPGQPNLLVVKTDSSKPEPGSPTADVLPVAGDFFIHGGLYRPVTLIATDPVHLEMMDHGGPGVYAATTALEGRAATVTVRAAVRNDGRRSARLMVTTRLVDGDGRIAAEQRAPLNLAPGAGATTQQTLSLGSARLWQGVADPFLYRLIVEVAAPGGRLLDRVEQNFGVRQIRIDPAQGVILNGKPLRLHGVGLHQDVEGKGWAMTAEDIARDVALAREMGANTIRLTHYQHGQVIHDLADRHGLIVWDEIPLVTTWTLGGAKQPTEGLVKNARQQLRELIRQNYNHPSVAVWGIANEVDFGNSLRAFTGGGPGDPPDPLPLLESLNALAKAEDPSRPTVQANCCEGRLFAADAAVPIVAPVTDLSGANRYFGWYYGQVGDLGPHLDATREARPSQPLSLTEYGAGGAITMHTDDPQGGPVDSRGRAQPEEYQSYIHEQTWATISQRPYLWATWLWNMADFATTIRREGDADDINTKGLVTYDRKTKKDAFFFYKANWTDTPTVHINGRRYVDRAYPVTDVRVYSNAPATELTVNGRSLGTLTDCPHRVCVWKSVQLAGGDTEVVASGRFNSGEVRDAVRWRLAADRASNIRIDAGAIMAAAPGFGSDAFFEGGRAGTLVKPADYGKPAEKVVIKGAENPDIAATYRQGAFRYRIPLQNGRYEVRLTFVEPSLGPGERRLDVAANGVRKIRNLDVAAVAGAGPTALVRSFTTQVTSGVLELAFSATKGDSLVAAIEVLGARQTAPER